MLSSLSSRPRPFASLIPSKDHRRAYLDILAWLLRHGWVTQLRTFGLLKIPKEIKLKVAQEQAMLEQPNQRQQAVEVSNPSNVSVVAVQATGLQLKTAQGSHTNNNNSTMANPSMAALSTQGQQPVPIASVVSLVSASQPAGTQPSPNATQTSLVTAPGASSQHPSFVIDSTLDDYEDSFILEPQQASSEESAWMEMITRDQPTDVTAVFDRYVEMFMCSLVCSHLGWVWVYVWSSPVIHLTLLFFLITLFVLLFLWKWGPLKWGLGRSNRRSKNSGKSWKFVIPHDNRLRAKDRYISQKF